MSDAPRLTALEIYRFAIGAGFDPVLATTMTAIALRESAGFPNAHNPVPPDDSYGLWQINLRDAGIRALMAQHDITVTNICDPATNARAAMLLYDHHQRNLAIAWAIDRDPWKAKYESHLPEAQAAALSHYFAPRTT